MIEGIIYKATNTVNGKVYIGLTILGLEKRRKAHISKANNKKLTDTYFYRALKSMERIFLLGKLLIILIIKKIYQKKKGIG